MWGLARPDLFLPLPKTEKKAKGRPKKGLEKKKLPKKNYNMRQHISVFDAVATAVSASSSKFQVDDSRIEDSGIRTTFKSWADDYDSANNILPMHGDIQVDQWFISLEMLAGLEMTSLEPHWRIYAIFEPKILKKHLPHSFLKKLNLTFFAQNERQHSRQNI